MARGDYAEVTYRTGVGVEKHVVRAARVGGEVTVKLPDRNDAPFIRVLEMDKAGKPVREARFATAEVVSIIEGNAPIAKAKK